MPRSKTTEAHEVRALIEWARASGVELTEVTVGSCKVMLGPTRLPLGPSRKPADPSSIYHTFGGDVIREISADLPGDEYTPAIGRK